VRLTIDASVHLNALNPAEAGSAASQELLRRVHEVAPEADASVAHEVVSPGITTCPPEEALRLLDQASGPDRSADREPPG
jgi:hypothetical protein